jgi:putative addiction module CopG family antidote
MPTRNISLTPEQDAFVESVVKAGEYQNATEVVRDKDTIRSSAGLETTNLGRR